MQDAIAVQSLKSDIALLRQNIWPPQNLANVEGLPIYYGTKTEVEDYYRQWTGLIERAQDLFQPFMEDEVLDAIHLPSHLNLPLFYFHVDRIRINKTRAKESKSFRGIASLIEKCGQFEPEQVQAMSAWLDSDDNAALVAHREFIDLRTYVFQHGQSEYTRTRFYVNGIVLSTEAHFELVDARDKPRKQRSDSYNAPLADNNTWKIYGKYR
ncbi:MAG: hypothetical protein A3F63_16480 [Pseudomonadales bacterium RIFCSPHIGHO2_12_FULL_40_16]|jgi:hypothetical protein|uniref:Uncharacterized protein n=1 Tax=Acinetobacter johnsonii TaxID=40214 RepID=A0A3Q8XFM7_ACIJO|nr:hypothetical protein [Acinetobacter johnsonii]OHC22293.1 MAG: hypothetical protein A3F63_16480 [Pseudomonadales bacterium RIFCSPHIGHO2_12_FULL_40_16]AZN64328.1 hypothetical protein CFH90_09945 [Acinetobacter johnsonii]MCF7642133.1 hypothetical protein [Acinetobacter johnsonii]MDH1520298.1 hypothetical protein [Acinetobacter johnsonii]MDH1704732.1 hypothetical protein [Acinetobacter johnsonii]